MSERISKATAMQACQSLGGTELWEQDARDTLRTFIEQQGEPRPIKDLGTIKFNDGMDDDDDPLPSLEKWRRDYFGFADDHRYTEREVRKLIVGAIRAALPDLDRRYAQTGDVWTGTEMCRVQVDLEEANKRIAVLEKNYDALNQIILAREEKIAALERDELTGAKDEK